LPCKKQETGPGYLASYGTMEETNWNWRDKSLGDNVNGRRAIALRLSFFGRYALRVHSASPCSASQSGATINQKRIKVQPKSKPKNQNTAL
jgi:hypothetical protein